MSGETQQELSSEFNRLQQQQQRRLERLKELRQQQQQQPSQLQSRQSTSAFGGVEDNLGLSTSGKANNNNNSNNNSSVETLELRDRVRALTDENGRLLKLVNEREFEIQRLQRAKDRLTMGGAAETHSGDTSGLAAAAASTKIVELSKKIRDITAELERERTKAAQLTRKCHELERTAASAATVPASAPAKIGKTAAAAIGVGDQETGSAVDANRGRKELKEKLKASDAKLADLRGQVQTLTRDLNIAKKALAEELGDSGVTPAQIISGQSAGWKGRQQQVLMLQSRVRDLEQRLKSADSNSLMMMSTGATSLGYEAFSSAASTQRGGGDRSSAATKDLQRLQRERRETAERAEKELKDLRDEREKLQERLDGAKARAKTLANDNKSLKSQVQTLLEKGRHDDELIASMMRQQERARTLLEEAIEARTALERAAHGETARQAVQRDQEARVIDRLKEIVADKEAQIRRLQQQQAGRRSGEDTDENFVEPLPLPLPLTQKVERAVSARPRTASSSRGGGGGGDGAVNVPDSGRMAVIHAELAELRALLSACEVERDRLRELAGVQETRYQHLLDREAKSSAQLQTAVRRLALIERQLEKSRQNIGGKAPPAPALSASSVAIETPSDAELASLLSDDLSPSKESVERLREALTACYEEAASLRRALQSALHSKNEDLKMLTDIIAQTREQFLSAFKAFKAQQ